MIRNFSISIFFLLSAGFINGVFSQQTAVYTNEWAEFGQALELYNNNQFRAARSLFEKIESSTTDERVKSESAYYIANSAIRLNQRDADQLMEDFVENYPTSPKRNAAYLETGNYYFDNGRYAHASKWYDKVETYTLNRSDQEKFDFNNGYVYFKANRFDEARRYFNRVSGSQQYGSQAKYYLGYMAYESDDYREAAQQFEQVKDEGRYGRELSYYQADMNFKLGNFEKAIEMGKEEYDRSGPQEKSQLSKIIGESYFNLGNYKEAIPYLKSYKGSQGRWNNTDYYQLGYAYYKQGDFQQAIGEFNKIIDGRNEVAQNAYYHLAESYLNLDQKQQALHAFKNASEMDFSREIQEDAWFNYAKLSYEIGNSYKDPSEVILSFLEAYPDNPGNNYLNELLIDSYISSKNYENALSILEKSRAFKGKEEIYQKVSFLRGMELYREGEYTSALSFFDKSFKENRNPEFSARAVFWKAESYFMLNNFEKALENYKKFEREPASAQTPENKNLSYNKGYANFKLKNYAAAISDFKRFTESRGIDNSRKKDAYLRLADSYFASSQYWPAMENYNAAMELGGANDYPHFQKAISYGFVDRQGRKVEELVSFIKQYPQSRYWSEAVYELGDTYVAQNKSEEAIRMYDRLVRETPKSALVPRAMMKKALILDNTGRSNEALTIFKQVATQYASTPEAVQAVASAKLIYIDQGKVDEYADWATSLGFVEVEDTELDNATYQAAEQPYRENKTGLAKTRFEDYLKRFPAGAHAVSSHFYLGQILFSENKKEAALPHFKEVADKDRNEHTEPALVRLSEIYLMKNDYENALKYLKKLETEASYPENVIFAQSNSMKAAYELKQYEKAVRYADEVLLNTEIETRIKNDAYVIIARSAMETGDEAKAKTAYSAIQKTASGQLAAEALYYDAYFKNKEGKFEASNTAVQNLAKEYPGFKRFGAKGLLLMARNFYALEDAYQAVYILENIIESFSEYPEVVSEAKTTLAEYKKTEAKTNASVEVTD